jgi:hypothetical protein
MMAFCEQHTYAGFLEREPRQSASPLFVHPLRC